MSVDFSDFSRRMDKALDHLADEFGAVREAVPMQRYWTASALNIMVVRHRSTVLPPSPLPMHEPW